MRYRAGGLRYVFVAAAVVGIFTRLFWVFS